MIKKARARCRQHHEFVFGNSFDTFDAKPTLRGELFDAAVRHARFEQGHVVCARVARRESEALAVVRPRCAARTQVIRTLSHDERFFRAANFVGSYSGTSSNYYFLYVAGQGYVETGNAVLEGPPSRDTNINGNGYILATLPGGTTSVGTDYRNVFSQSTLYTNGMNVIVTTSDNQTQTFSLNATNARQFAGFSVVTPGVTIASLQFSSAYNAQTGQRNYPVLDNFTFRQQAVAPVPEPATMLLFGTGLFGVGAAARRRRKVKGLPCV